MWSGAPGEWPDIVCQQSQRSFLAGRVGPASTKTRNRATARVWGAVAATKQASFMRQDDDRS